ncbi:DNA cytosine methyltransferase [Parapedobacter sp. GCM10030251]|uniref:DNA cytosine methyltransferase n=1 Tax=Parapedobacter sp. GCM10030251 TaxID=3273419 RepID=UPI003624432F
MTGTSIDKTVIEFFAGIGLMRMGLEKGGWKVECANDIDPVKKRLYVSHFKNNSREFILDDIHRLSSNDLPSSSLATASFPCTDLSLAGRRAGLQGIHSSAFWGFVNILKKLGKKKPPLILLENVVGFLTSHQGKDFEQALLALNQLGYAVDAFIINAAHFVPQSRVRLFVVGSLTVGNCGRSAFCLPDSELRPPKLREFITKNPHIDWNVRAVLPELPRLDKRLADIVEDIPKNNSVWFSKQRVDYLLNQTFERHLNKVLDQKEKDNYEYYTAFRRVRNGKSMAEIRFDGIAGCLRTPKGGSARQILLQVGKGEINIRLLTPRECARLMGADDFTLSGTFNEALFGFGDAVCVPVVSWIAENYLNPLFYEAVPRKTTKMRYETAI